MKIAKYWKTIVDTLRDGLLVIDPGGKIISVNPAAEKITGYNSNELIGRSCTVLGCTGCKIIGKGLGVDWCNLFIKGKVEAKRCMLTNKQGRAVHIIKNASVLVDTDGTFIGAVETLTDMSEIVKQQQEIANLKKTCFMNEGYYGMIGSSPAIQSVFELIDSVAQSEAPVLILGQSGTGKELVARAIHGSSLRHNGPFIKVNCAALNENILESELFGHVKGAFTGADKTRIGRFEAAHRGTILLDEIGDIPLSTQVKLLRVLEEREIERVGDHRPIPVNVRLITSTNKNLEKRVDQGLFREDLFFRINVFPIICPKLSERKEDIPLIVQHFIDHHIPIAGKKIIGLTSEAMEKLLEYSWPGNVRELRNAIEYAFVLCPGQWIEKEHLPPKILNSDNSYILYHNKKHLSTDDTRAKEKLIHVLRKAGGNQSKAAKMLKISRVTMWKRIKKYAIDIEADVKNHLD